MSELRAELYRHLREEQFESAFRLAESAVEKATPEAVHPDFLYGGCLALFGLGHIQQARRWAEDYEKKRSGSPKSFYLQSFIALHARKSDEALLLLTRIIQVDPGDTFADRLISKIKRGQDRILDELDKPGTLYKFVPLPDQNRSMVSIRPGLTFSRRAIATTFSILIAGSAIGAGVFFYNYFTNPFTGLSDSLPVIPESTTVLPPEAGEVEYRYENISSAADDFKQARNLISEGKVNQARKLLSKLERSNADFLLRDRATLLRQSIPEIELQHFQDSVTPGQYMQDPFAYRDADVYWRGQISKLRTDSSSGVQYFQFAPLEANAAFQMKAYYPYLKLGKPALESEISGSSVQVFARIQEKTTEMKVLQIDH